MKDNFLLIMINSNGNFDFKPSTNSGREDGARFLEYQKRFFFGLSDGFLSFLLSWGSWSENLSASQSELPSGSRSNDMPLESSHQI
jgi:hypothetical protein